MAYIRGLKNACPNCKGNVQYLHTKLICLDCFRVEDISNISGKQRNALEAKLVNIPMDVTISLSRAGRFFLKEFPGLVRILNLLAKMDKGEELTSEERLELDKCGFLETWRPEIDENT